MLLNSRDFHLYIQLSFKQISLLISLSLCRRGILRLLICLVASSIIIMHFLNARTLLKRRLESECMYPFKWLVAVFPDSRLWVFILNHQIILSRGMKSWIFERTGPATVPGEAWTFLVNFDSGCWTSLASTHNPVSTWFRSNRMARVMIVNNVMVICIGDILWRLRAFLRKSRDTWIVISTD